MSENLNALEHLKLNISGDFDYESLQEQITYGSSKINDQKIIIQNPGITAQELNKFSSNLICFNELKLSQTDKNKLSTELCKVYDNLVKYDPEAFEDLLIYYKTVCAVFLLQDKAMDIYISQKKIYLLQKAFSLNILNWDHNPVILHMICKTIFEVTEIPKNLIYLARKISAISRTSFYISVCLMWTIFFQILKIEKKMFRFHKFSTLIENLEKFQIDPNDTNLNDLYMLLETISFLQIAIVHKKNITDDLYCTYFQYENNDLFMLKNWCENIRRSFEFNAKSETTDYSLINDIIVFDIVYMLDNALPQENYNDTYKE